MEGLSGVELAFLDGLGAALERADRCTGLFSGRLRLTSFIFPLIFIRKVASDEPVIAQGAVPVPSGDSTKLVLSSLCRPAVYNRSAQGVGPRGAVKRLQSQIADGTDVDVWLDAARNDAILDSCRLSMKSVRSGVRCYLAFLETVAPRATPFPPRLDILMAWSTNFRHEGTFGNYIGYVRTACLLCGVSADVRAVFLFSSGGSRACVCDCMLSFAAGPCP